MHPAEVDAASRLVRPCECRALLAFATNAVASHRARLTEPATRHGPLSISDFPLLAQAGFVLSFGPDLDDLGPRSIAYVNRILKGARPGHLPIARPTELRWVVNLEVAGAIGVTIPRSLLLQADEVIE